MGMSKMETGYFKIFISRLNDFEIAHDIDCYNVQTVERGDHFAEKAVVTSRNVGYFLRLKIGWLFLF